MARVPFRVSNVAERSKHRRIHAMHFVHSNRTGQPWVKPGHDETRREERSGEAIQQCHSGMVRKHQTRNLEIPGSMLRIAPE
jgi:hypothetical protein